MEIDKILITGGGGFVGRNLMNYLLETTNCEIHILDDESNSDHEMWPLDNKRVYFIPGSITQGDSCKYAVEGMDAIVHLAAQTSVPYSMEDPIYDAYANILGIVNMLEEARQQNIKKFIFASSNAVIGDVDPKKLPMHEEMETVPISPYGVSKLTSEQYCRIYQMMFDVPTISLRFSNIYGKYSEFKESVIPKFIRKIEKGETIKVYGDGEQTRDFLYADDLAEAITNAIFLDNKVPEIFCLASGVETTINNLLNILTGIYNKTLDVKYIDERPGDIKFNYSSIKKAKEILDWTPKTSLRDGITALIEYEQENYNKVI